MTAIDIHGIRNLLPHRYPFLLIDRVEVIDPGVRIEAVKNITANEPIFQGHFPDYPVLPGVLLIESIAQAAAILASKTEEVESASTDMLYLLAGINRARFKQPVVPGDQLVISVTVDRKSGRLWRCPGQIFVKESVVCDAEVLFTHRSIE